MAVEKVIAATLEGVEGLDTVGENGYGRVFPLEGLKNARPPFSFYRRLNWDEEDALDGPTGLQECVLEIHFVAARYAEMAVIAARAVSALRALQQTETGGIFFEVIKVRQTSPDLYEEEVNLYRRMVAVTINYQEV